MSAPRRPPLLGTLELGTGMGIGYHSFEITIRFLLSNPFQKRLKLGRRSQGIQVVVDSRQLSIPECCMNLLMTGPAQWNPVRRLTALLLGQQMMQRDQPLRHKSAAEMAYITFNRGSILHVILG